MRSIAVVGAGAVGCYYGGRLAAAGEEVRFLMRSDLEVVQRSGLRVESVAGDFVLESPWVHGSSHEIGPVDLVIVAWKATANAALEEVITPLLHEHTAILTLQNGLGNTERLAELFGAERVFGGLCFVCINRVGPGHIRHLAKGLVTVGAYRDHEGASLTSITDLFNRAGVECRKVDDLATAQWQKLVWNVPFNGLCIAEGGITTAELLASDDGEREVRALMREVIKGAGALGLMLSDDLIEQQVRSTREMGAYRPSSMIDYMEGRAVEVDAIWAEPLRRARAAGADLPSWERLLARIRSRLAERC